jgi:hypothetical protein
MTASGSVVKVATVTGGRDDIEGIAPIIAGSCAG